MRDSPFSGGFPRSRHNRRQAAVAETARLQLSPTRHSRAAALMESEVFERGTQAASHLRLEMTEIVRQQQLRARMDESDASIRLLGDERAHWRLAAMRARQEEAIARARRQEELQANHSVVYQNALDDQVIQGIASRALRSRRSNDLGTASSPASSNGHDRHGSGRIEPSVQDGISAVQLPSSTVGLGTFFDSEGFAEAPPPGAVRSNMYPSVGSGEMIAELQGDFNTYLQTYYELPVGNEAEMMGVEELRAAQARMQRLELNVLHARLHGLRLILAMSQQALRSRAADLQAELTDMDLYMPVGGETRPFISSLMGLQEQPTIPSGVPPDELETKMPQMLYSAACVHVPATRDVAAGLECSICLSELHDKEMVRLLPCKHVYHVHCVDKWFTRSNKCPCCKEIVYDPGSG